MTILWTESKIDRAIKDVAGAACGPIVRNQRMPGCDRTHFAAMPFEKLARLSQPDDCDCQ